MTYGATALSQLIGDPSDSSRADSHKKMTPTSHQCVRRPQERTGVPSLVRTVCCDCNQHHKMPRHDETHGGCVESSSDPGKNQRIAKPAIASSRSGLIRQIEGMSQVCTLNRQVKFPNACQNLRPE